MLVTIDVPDEVHGRAKALGLDVEHFLIESLRATVAAMEDTVKAAAHQEQAEEKRGRGRIPKAAGRVPTTLYIEKPWYDRLSAMASRMGISKGDALNKVLEEAAAAGFLPPVK